MNLLKNPSFDEGVHRQAYDEIMVPDDWIAFWSEGLAPPPWDPQNLDGYKRPEMSVITEVEPFLEPARLSHPPKAVKFFTFMGIHEAGIHQRVINLEPGKTVRATFDVHGWSSVGDDPKVSDYVDGGPFNLMFTVGIDPTGGQDPWSFSVIWGEAKGVYNKFEEVVSADVVIPEGSEAVTVFFRSQVRWRLKHNDVYVDNGRLEYVDDPSPPPEPPPTPPP